MQRRIRESGYSTTTRSKGTFKHVGNILEDNLPQSKKPNGFKFLEKVILSDESKFKFKNTKSKEKV